jgi:peptidoglycan hydrolase CwlO-like protein
MDGKMDAFIYMLIQSIVFLTPVVIVFYKQGKKDQHMNELEKDVNGIGKKLSEIKDNQTGTLMELSRKVDGVEKSIVELSTSMKFMTETIKELKR